jgi:hypothetical protein
MGWGTEDPAQALGWLRLRLSHGQRPHSPDGAEGAVTFHTARSTAFPQPAPGSAPSPCPMKVPEDKLRSVLGIATVAVKQGTQPLAITDSDLTKV